MLKSAGVTYDNSNRVIIVTGGCSGIGFAICDRFAKSGAKVVCADINQSAADALPSGVEFKSCDTSSSENCRSVVSATVEEFGELDVLVNNAAIQPKAAYCGIDELADDVFEQVVSVNLAGYHYMAKHAIAQMKRQGSGVVCNIASGQGHRSAREVGAYGPIKAANIMQTRQWAIEYAREGIRVVSVSPGAIDTPLVRGSLEEQGGEAALADRHPLGRIGKPDEVANAVLWLCSDHASFITGTDLEVDGGLGAFGAFADPYPESNG